MRPSSDRHRYESRRWRRCRRDDQDDCVPSWLTDFRNDLPRIDVPTLIIHGDVDRILPLESTAARLPKLIKTSQLVIIPGGPHAINWTHADQVNPVLLDFLQG
ncbi:MAG TPA: alpha/beta hydrolase [Trichocoleus sp.]